MSRPDAFMPLFIGDYLADTMHLTDVQHGNYLLLIMHYWRSGKPLPVNDDALRNIARASADGWKRNRETVLAFFTTSADGLHHKRIDDELSKASAKYEARKSAAHASHVARNSKRDANRLHCNSNADATTTTLSSPSGKERVARQAARGRGAQPGSPQNLFEKARDWADECAEGRWRLVKYAPWMPPRDWSVHFGNARPNGSLTTLLMQSRYSASFANEKFGEKIDEAFGEHVTMKFEPPQPKENSQ